MTDTVDPKAAHLERELMGHLTALTEENRHLSPALGATQRLVDHRRTMSEFIEHTLRDAIRLGELQEDIQHLERKREALRQIVDQNVAALQQQFEETVLAMHGALELLSGAQDFARETESRLSALLEELKETEFLSGDGDDATQFDVQRPYLSSAASTEEVHVEPIDHRSSFVLIGQNDPASRQVTLEDTGEGFENETSAEARADSPSIPGTAGPTDILMERTPRDEVRTETLSCWWLPRVEIQIR